MDDPARIHETHISWITLIADRAYKLLKPIRTGFLDHRTREARRAACLRELEVNRRFAADVYLGVLDLVDAAGQPRDHIIEMRRMPADRRLTTLVEAPGATDAVEEVARALAAIHRDAPRSAQIDRAGEAEWLRDLWATGWEQLTAAAPGVIAGDDIARAARLARRFLTAREPLFRARIAGGWIRDGHGDLLADDIYVTADGPRVLDCLAFDDDLRIGDVLSDIAFLAMDLERLGRPALAAALVATWSAALAEDHPPALLHHHVAYRAHVRAKVTAIRHVQGDGRAGDRARALHRLCLEHLEAGRVRLVLVGGAPGTGKSTVARELTARTGWSLLASDALRGDVVGPAVPNGDDYRQGRYADDARDRVYTHMRELAATELGMGRSVILDASWSAAPQRERARRLAGDLAADLIELRCDAPPDISEARIAARRDDPSEATAEVATQMRHHYDPWPTATALPTTIPLDDTIARALTHTGPT